METYDYVFKSSFKIGDLVWVKEKGCPIMTESGNTEYILTPTVGVLKEIKIVIYSENDASYVFGVRKENGRISYYEDKEVFHLQAACQHACDFNNDLVIMIAKEELNEEKTYITHYEKIKNMTLEEMANEFEKREFFAVALNGEYGDLYERPIDWLESEVEK